MRRAPQPPASLLLGHARELARDPLSTLVDWMGAYGPVVRFRVGRREAHVVYSAEGVRRVLADPDGIYGKNTHGYRTLRLFVGNGLLTSEGATWVNQRRVLQPAFHRASLLSYVDIMTDVAERTAREMAAHECVRIEDVAMRATLEIVGRTLFGTDLAARSVHIASAITDLQIAAQRKISAPFGIPFFLPTPQHLRIRRARRRLTAIFDTLIAERTRSASSRGDALDLLLAARDESGAPLDRTLVHDELLTLLIAGHESTANALTWCLALLARNPTEVRLLRIELDALEGPITFDALTRLPRTRAVIDETLRLYPPAWSFGRAPIRDDTVDGFLLPKDHLVMIVPWAIHRDRNVFPHPEAFEPDRFLRGEPPPFSYLPFGGGARTCIGHAFARTEARVLLATWIRDLDFELVAGQSLDPVPLVTLRPRDGVSMRVQKRAS